MPFCFIRFGKLNQSNGIHYCLHTVKGVDFHSNADPVALKLVTHNKIMLWAGMGSCVPSLKCKRKAHCVAVTDSFILINVSTMKARCSPVQSWHKLKKKQKIMALYRNKTKRHYMKKMALYILFKNKNTFLFLYKCVRSFCLTLYIYIHIYNLSTMSRIQHRVITTGLNLEFFLLLDLLRFQALRTSLPYYSPKAGGE